MRPWTVLLTGLVVLTFGHSHANAGQDQSPQNIVVAQADDLPSNIELKPEAVKATEEDAQDQTRQIVTESKDAAAEDDTDKADKTDDDADTASDTAAATEKPADAETTAATPEKPAEPEKTAEADADDEDEDELTAEELALATQTELKRVGCYGSALDGVWGGGSRAALDAFGDAAEVEVGDLSPTVEILAVVKGKTGIVCEVVEVEAPPPVHRRKGYGGGGYGGGGYGGY